MRLSATQYDELEAALRDGRRIVVVRRGSEFIVIPTRLTSMRGRDAIEAAHPTTGDVMTFVLDDLDDFEVVA
jgi:uncharacterized protein with PhoU and TrkA domain